MKKNQWTKEELELLSTVDKTQGVTSELRRIAALLPDRTNAAIGWKYYSLYPTEGSSPVISHRLRHRSQSKLSKRRKRKQKNRNRRGK